ncbi:sialate O-acetylesterase [Gordonia hongkongensis]|uniref:sialate O-acetylesterase n=1 Tax=Gordonia hongkongensis TaxID=1701090 RepID=UPI003EB7681D
MSLDVISYGAAKRAQAAALQAANPDDVGYDIILLIGQSNMVGGGSDTVNTTWLDPADPRILQFPGSGPYENQIVAALEPLYHRYQGATAGPGLPFARDYVRQIPLNRKVLLVPAAKGSTGFAVSNSATWDRTNTTNGVENLYTVATTQLDLAIAAAGANSRVTAILWIQGENDAGLGMSAATYQAHLDGMIDALRTRYGATIPFVVGQMVPSFIASSGGAYVAINDVHIDTPRRKPYCAFAYGASGPGTVNASQPIHYSAAGGRLNGTRLAAALLLARGNVPGTPPAAPGAWTMVQSGTSLTGTWQRKPGRVTDYNVRTRVNGGSWTAQTRAQSLHNAFTLTGLSTGDVVEMQARTVNEQGTSDWGPVGSFTMQPLPAQVTGVSIGAVTMSTIGVSWSAATNALSYRVQYRPTGSSTWIDGPTTTALSATVTGTSASRDYDLRVVAVNGAGDGTPSETITQTTAAPGILSADVGSTPIGAWGLRKLVSTYTGPTVLLRRSSDNATQAFTPNQTTGMLDQAAILAWGGSSSLYVVTLYDQGTGAKNLTALSAGQQPRLADAGVLDKVNGTLAMLFTASASQFLRGAGNNMLAQEASSVLMVVHSSDLVSRYPFSEWGANGARYIPGGYDSATSSWISNQRDDTTVLYTTGYAPNTGLQQRSMVEDGNACRLYEGGTLKTTSSGMTAPGTTTMNYTGLGCWAAGNFWNSYIGEVVVWPLALSTTARQAGEANQKAYFALA